MNHNKNLILWNTNTWQMTENDLFTDISIKYFIILHVIKMLLTFLSFFFIQAKLYFYSNNSFIVVYRFTSGYFGMTCRERILYKHWTLCDHVSVQVVVRTVSFEHTITIVRRVLFVYHSFSIVSALQINIQQYIH